MKGFLLYYKWEEDVEWKLYGDRPNTASLFFSDNCDTKEMLRRLGYEVKTLKVGVKDGVIPSD